MTLHTIPPFEGDVADPDKILLRYQQDLNASAALHALTVVEKSRRIGATWGFASEAVLTASKSRAAHGMDVLYLGPSLDMAREFVDACGQWAKDLLPVAIEVEECLFKDQKKGQEDRDIQAFRIKFASGFEILALSSAPRSLRGRQGMVIIDEAAFHDDLEEVLKAALALLIWGGKVVVISTHDGAENAYNRLIQDIRGGRQPGNVIRVDFDDALRDGLYKRICQIKGEEWTRPKQDAWRADIIATYGSGADEELFCIPSEGSGAFLTRALLEARTTAAAPVIRWEQDDEFNLYPDSIREAICRDFCNEHLKPLLNQLNPHWRTVLGGDFGRSGDLSVFWPLVVEPGLKRTTPFLVELRNIPHRQQEQILFYILDNLPKLSGVAMDARGNGEYLAERAAQRYGTGLVEQVKLSQEWYRNNMPKYKAAFEDAMISIPADEDVVNDHRALVVEKGIAKLPERGGRQKGTDGKQRHGDAAIAGAMAHYASQMEVMEYDYRAVSTNDDQDNGNAAPLSAYGNSAGLGRMKGAF